METNPNSKKEFTLRINTTLSIDDSPEKIRMSLLNNLYELGQFYFEMIGEYGDFIKGNGHHAAQDIVKSGVDMWDERLFEKHKPTSK